MCRDVIDLLKSGRIPVEIGVSFRGVKLDISGYSYEWDLKKNSVLPVIEISTVFVGAVDYSLRTKQKFFRQHKEPPFAPASRSHVAEILSTFVNVLRDPNSIIVSSLRWMIVLLGIIAAASVVRLFWH